MFSAHFHRLLRLHGLAGISYLTLIRLVLTQIRLLAVSSVGRLASFWLLALIDLLTGCELLALYRLLALARLLTLVELLTFNITPLVLQVCLFGLICLEGFVFIYEMIFLLSRHCSAH